MSAKKFKLCIDPGHGMASRMAGVYDSGAVSGTLEEAGLVLVWAHCLRKACEDLGLPVFMTRETRADVAPLRSRTANAVKAGCTHLLSLHINDADTAAANGFETLFRTKRSSDFAENLHMSILRPLGLKSRGVKLRTDLAVLGSSKLTSALLELGFIQNRGDMQIVTSTPVMQSVCKALAKALEWEAKRA